MLNILYQKTNYRSLIHIFLWHVNFDFNFLVEKGAEQGLPETHILTASKKVYLCKDFSSNTHF